MRRWHGNCKMLRQQTNSSKRTENKVRITQHVARANPFFPHPLVSKVMLDYLLSNDSLYSKQMNLNPWFEFIWKLESFVRWDSFLSFLDPKPRLNIFPLRNSNWLFDVIWMKRRDGSKEIHSLVSCLVSYFVLRTFVASSVIWRLLWFARYWPGSFRCYLFFSVL